MLVVRDFSFLRFQFAEENDFPPWIHENQIRPSERRAPRIVGVIAPPPIEASEVHHCRTEVLLRDALAKRSGDCLHDAFLSPQALALLSCFGSAPVTLAA